MKTGDSRWRSILPRLHKYTPRRQANGNVSHPVIHNNVLYWMIECKAKVEEDADFCCEEAILRFDVQTEEFQKLSHPDKRCADIHEACVKHERMHLLKTKSENISVIDFCEKITYVKIWEWERRSMKWTMKNKIRAAGCDNYRVFGMVDEETVLLRVLALGQVLQREEMSMSGFYVLNLKKATVKALECERFNRGFVNALECERFIHGFACAHTPTFATISRDGGEVRVRVPSIADIIRSKNVIY